VFLAFGRIEGRPRRSNSTVVRSIGKRQLAEGGPIGVLDERALREVIKAIGFVIESDW
jgi:hypothetical protein